jgi:hypothetical protein
MQHCRWANHDSMPTRAKKNKKNQKKTKNKTIVRSYLKNKPGMVTCICNPNYLGGRLRKIQIQGHRRAKKHNTLSEK